jgi:hypothetical protein
VNITDEDAIINSQYDIVQSLGSYDWKNLTYNVIDDLYEATFDLRDYEYGNWFIVVNATDTNNFTSIGSKLFEFNPFITYNINYSQITYNMDGIDIYSNPLSTTEIIASFMLNHDSVMKPREFEIYINVNYTDAYDYSIIRGFNTYTPQGFDVQGIHTTWILPNYQATDLVRFFIEKPRIKNDLIETTTDEDGLDTHRFTFQLSSKHPFTNVRIHNTLTKFIPNPEDFTFKLEYLFEDNWIEIEDIVIEAEATPDFTFVWDSIDSNSTIQFRFTAVEHISEESPIGIWFLIGALIGGVAVFFYGIYANYRDFWSESKAKTILYGLLVFGIGFAGGIGIGYMLAPPIA